MSVFVKMTMKINFIKKIIELLIPYGLMKKHRIKKNELKLNEIGSLDGPVLYNKNGGKINVYYLSDSGSLGFQFYSFTEYREPREIFWDRNNIALNIHFYSHQNIKRTIGKPRKKFAIIVETESIDPIPYKYLLNNPNAAREFDAIFTHSEKILNRYENTKFIPAGGVWYGMGRYGGKLDSLAYTKKEKNVSIVSSNKKMCELHVLRMKMAEYLKGKGLADAFGTFDGGNNIKISESLQNYRYSIIIENTIESYCFTEKILNCFAAMTIPIYLGAPKIGDFFNKDGIIFLDKKNALEKIQSIINSCNEENYWALKDALIDNYNRVLEYTCQEDYISNNYKELL